MRNGKRAGSTPRVERSYRTGCTGGSASGYGFTAIIVAWLSKFNTFYMAFISLFLVALEKGTNHIADSFSSFDSSASQIVIGIILFFVIGSEFFIHYKLNFRSRAAKEV